MALPFPTPLPAWAKFGVLNDIPTLPDYYRELLQYIENLSTDDQWRHLEVKFHNTATGAVVQDDMFITFDITNITGGQLDSTWTSTDYTTCETKITTFLNSWQSYMVSWLTVTEYRWYVRSFNPLTEGKPFPPHGPPDRVTSVSLPGSSGSSQAPQVAMSVTERTPWSKHWGRFYLPGPSATVMQTGGRFTTTMQNAMATAAGALYSGMAGSDFQIVVPILQVDKIPNRSLVGVSSIQVDDVPDIIRRRRPRNPLLRVVKP